MQQSICSRQLQATHSILQNLEVGNNNFSGDGIHILAAFMYVYPCMRSLVCLNCGIASNDLKQLLLLVSKLSLELSCLASWDLSSNDIDDDGVSALIRHLSIFPMLNDVTLDGNTRVSPGMLETLEEKLNAPREVHLCFDRSRLDIGVLCYSTNLETALQ